MKYNNLPSKKVVEFNGEKFVVLKNNVSRHFSRVNGEDLVLAETCMWFDVASREESRKISNIHMENNIPVPESEEKCVSSDAYIPQYLILNDGEVMKKRKSRKILVYPKTFKSAFDKMYTQLLLFYPIVSEELLNYESMIDMYSEYNEDGETIVSFNER